MSVSAVVTSRLTVTETVSDTYVSASDNTLTFSGLDTNVTLNAGSDVPATTHAAWAVTMSGGAATIDLRAMTGANGAAIDGNGLKVQACKFRNKTDNANTITITEGASNGYALLGAGFTLDLTPGQWVQLFLNEDAPNVSGTDKTIDISGTGSQVLEVQFVLG